MGRHMYVLYRIGISPTTMPEFHLKLVALTLALTLVLPFALRIELALLTQLESRTFVRIGWHILTEQMKARRNVTKT